MGKFLSEMKPPRGAVKNKKRLGRGDASGHGGTSTKGHKGQRARAGGYHKGPTFEGGQMPLVRRVPKRGFTNIFRKEYTVVNLADLEGIPAGTVVDAAYLKANRRIRKLRDGLKVLGDGELKVALTVVAEKFSETAKQKIEKSGGTAKLAQAAS
ncbi:50S ribosomal protein L15 [Deltaproteobacteria bacterium PRO3]|nr:50S ribosomal protein L15 [Deltaproteobacteria bacterium PRO3]